MTAKDLTGIRALIEVVAALRDPDEGCPWDLKQTHQTLRPYMLEEAYEAVDAIDSGDVSHIKEELGDVLLQVMLHAQLASERDDFTVDEVAQGIADKLVYRHPHVFGDVSVADAEEVTANWEALKAAEKKEKNTDPLGEIPRSLSALMRAHKVSKRAVKQGFKWPNMASLWSCVMSEFDELQEAMDDNASADVLEDELGDILFAVVSLAHQLDVDPEVALNRSTNKFMQRYTTMHTLMDNPLDTYSFEELDAFWEQAKASLSAR